MTVTSLIARQVFPGTGAQTQFAYTFLIPEPGDEQVYITDSSGNITGPLANTLYTITGYGLNTGGVITYPLIGSPLPVGSTLTLARVLAETQETSFDNQGPYFPSAVEQSLDYLTMISQQITDLQGRALTVPLTDPTPLPLPSVNARKNQLLGFDGSGNPVAAQPSSAIVSSAMQPVVAASTLALARTAMGLGTMAVGAVGYGLQNDGAGNIRVNAQTYDDAVSVNPVPASYHMTRRDATGPITYTMARANTYWNGFQFNISAITGGPITIAIDSHDAFVGFSPGASVIIYPGQFATITTDGASTGTWYIEVTGQAQSTVVIPNAQTGSSYQIQQSDWGKLVTRTNAIAITDTIPQATGSFGNGFWLYYQNVGSSLATLTPSAGTIGGKSALRVPPGGGVMLVSDGANWQLSGNPPPDASRYLLNTLTATASVTTVLQDTTSFLSGFTEFQIVVTDFMGATATDMLAMQVQAGGTYQTTNYNSYEYFVYSGGANASLSAACFPLLNGNQTWTITAPGGCLELRVTSPNRSGGKALFRHSGGLQQATINTIVESFVGQYNAASAVTGFQMFPNNSLVTPVTNRPFGAATTVKVYGWL